MPNLRRTRGHLATNDKKFERVTFRHPLANAPLLTPSNYACRAPAKKRKFYAWLPDYRYLSV